MTVISLPNPLLQEPFIRSLARTNHQKYYLLNETIRDRNVRTDFQFQNLPRDRQNWYRGLHIDESVSTPRQATSQPIFTDADTTNVPFHKPFIDTLRPEQTQEGFNKQ